MTRSWHISHVFPTREIDIKAAGQFQSITFSKAILGRGLMETNFFAESSNKVEEEMYLPSAWTLVQLLEFSENLGDLGFLEKILDLLDFLPRPSISWTFRKI